MKKVTFREDRNKVYYMITWDFAYRAARRCNMLDRIRFDHRIQETAKIINPILDVNHRNNMYEKIKYYK